jgi:hypothetical protein
MLGRIYAIVDKMLTHPSKMIRLSLDAR